MAQTMESRSSYFGPCIDFLRSYFFGGSKRGDSFGRSTNDGLPNRQMARQDRIRRIKIIVRSRMRKIVWKNPVTTGYYTFGLVLLLIAEWLH